MPATMLDRNHHLVESNLALLRQAMDLLSSLDDATYSHKLPLLFSNSIGAQMRHIVEFYECFLDGLDAVCIDYDARRRDDRLESSTAAAIEKIGALTARIATLHSDDGLLWVRMEDAPAANQDPFLTSSASRELQVLLSHTVHHFALIAVALRLLGIAVHPHFGVAPSTLRYRQHQAA
ncbi:MAG: hypothetical protein JNK48_07180 [Bryobacterales bacterium]|nr:hypothetical protein [Bryobacterales bacterium]